MQQGCDFLRSFFRPDAPAGVPRDGGDARRVAGHCCCLFPRREIIDDLPTPSCPECKHSGGESARAVRTVLADWL